MSDCKSNPTPIALQSSTTQTTDSSPFHDTILYHSLVGSLQYATITCSELSFAVNAVCQTMHQPSVADFSAVKRVLRYPQSTKTVCLHLTSSSLNLHAYLDSDWVVDPTDRHSITGNCIFLGSNLVLWTAKKQHSVAKLSTKVENKALACTTMDITWISMILDALFIWLSTPPSLYCDNISAIALRAHLVFHFHTTYIAVDYHFVREKAQCKELTVHVVPYDLQLVDLFTKPLTFNHFNFLISKLMVGPPINLRGG